MVGRGSDPPGPPSKKTLGSVARFQSVCRFARPADTSILHPPGFRCQAKNLLTSQGGRVKIKFPGYLGSYGLGVPLLAGKRVLTALRPCETVVALGTSDDPYPGLNSWATEKVGSALDTRP